MTATATKRLTRAEACAELATRMGIVVFINAASGVVLRQEKASSERVIERPWNPFTSRDAAHELVRWFDSQGDEQFLRLMEELAVILGNARKPLKVGIGFSVDLSLRQAMLATPEQITLAACAALGIEVE